MATAQQPQATDASDAKSCSGGIHGGRPEVGLAFNCQSIGVRKERLADSFSSAIIVRLARHGCRPTSFRCSSWTG